MAVAEAASGVIKKRLVQPVSWRAWAFTSNEVVVREDIKNPPTIENRIPLPTPIHRDQNQGQQ
jgi:hypothetical protein